MDYNNAFGNLGKALSGEINPVTVGQAPATPELLSTTEDKSRVGTIAGLPSDKLLDFKEHFPVTTVAQAQSSIARILQLTEVPSWYRGSLSDLRGEVRAGINKVHPNIELNVRVPIEQAVAISIKDPADCCPSQVPGAKRPTLTSAEIFVALKVDASKRKAFASQLTKMLDAQLASVQHAKEVCGRLLSDGITAEEFAELNLYIQNDILREIVYLEKEEADENETEASKILARRRELINKIK